MQLQEMKNMLVDHAEGCMRLADKMDSDGRELNSRERRLIRIASIPIIEESMELLTSAYLSGNKDFVELEISRLKSIAMDYI